MPSTITSKCSCTNGIPPKKYPTSTNRLTQEMPPTALKNVNFPEVHMSGTGENGAKVRKNGMNRVMMIVSPP